MDGILIVDKPRDCTSHDIVDFIRKKFNIKKAGHAGTLDPMATGVLVILIGKCTKLSNTFLGEDKEYDASLILGATSDTQDACGRIKPFSGPGLSGPGLEKVASDIEKVFQGFRGEIEQVPPPYSAIKFKGRKLYQLARKGIEVKLPPRKVFIKKLEISGIKMPEISFSVTCSKGTYIRQLAADIGSALGCGAYLSRLRRTRSGNFNIQEALSLEELKKLDADTIKSRLRAQ